MKSIVKQKITPFLWFDGNAEEAMNFYISVFKNGEIKTIKRYGSEVPGMKGKVLTGIFELFGQEFMVIDGGPMFNFTEAISLMVNCDTQEEVDELWEKFTKDGKESMCGWLKDKYGLSWQIIPAGFGKLMSDPDPEKSTRVMMAMMQMKKLDMRILQQAYDNKL